MLSTLVRTWDVPGGDFVAEPSGAADLALVADAAAGTSIAVTGPGLVIISAANARTRWPCSFAHSLSASRQAADVRRWMSLPSANFGWLLQLDSTGAVAGNVSLVRPGAARACAAS